MLAWPTIFMQHRDFLHDLRRHIKKAIAIRTSHCSASRLCNDPLVIVPLITLLLPPIFCDNVLVVLNHVLQAKDGNNR